MSATFVDFLELHDLICLYRIGDKLLTDQQLEVACKRFKSVGRKYKYSDGIESILEEWADKDWLNYIKADPAFTQTMSRIMFRLKWWLNRVSQPNHILSISLCSRRSIFISVKFPEIDPANLHAIAELRQKHPNSLPWCRGDLNRAYLDWRLYSAERNASFWGEYYKFWAGNSWVQASQKVDVNTRLLEEREARGVEYGIIYNQDGREQVQVPEEISIDGKSYSGKKARSHGEKAAVNNFLIIDGRSYIPSLRLLSFMKTMNPTSLTSDQLGTAIIVMLQIYEGLSLQQVLKIGLSDQTNSAVGTIDLNTRQIKRIIGGEWTTQASEIFEFGEFMTQLVDEIIPLLQEVKSRKIKAELVQDIFAGSAVDEYQRTLTSWLGCHKKDIITRAGALHKAMFYCNLIIKPIAQVPVANLISQTFHGGERAANAYYGIKDAELANTLQEMQNNLRGQIGLTPLTQQPVNNNQQLGSHSEAYTKLINDVIVLAQSANASERQMSFTKLIQLLGARNRQNHYVPLHYYSREMEMFRLNEKKVSGAKVPRFVPVDGLSRLIEQLPKKDKDEQILYDGQTWTDYVAKNPHARKLLRGEYINNHRRAYITWLISNRVGQVPRSALTGQGPAVLKSFGIHTLQSPSELYKQINEALTPLFKSVGLDHALNESLKNIDLSTTSSKVNQQKEETESGSTSEELMPDGESYVSPELTEKELVIEKQFDELIRKQKLSSPRMTALFSLIWELSLPWTNVLRGQAYYSFNSFFRRTNGDLYFCVPIKQNDKGGLGFWPVQFNPTSFTTELNKRIERALSENNNELSWLMTGKKRIVASSTKLYLREYLSSNQINKEELYMLFKRITLRRCFRQYSGYAAAAFADLRNQSTPNYVSVYDMMRLCGETNGLVNLLGQPWRSQHEPSKSRLTKVKPSKFVPQKRNLVYNFNNLPDELVKCGNPKTWGIDAFILFFGVYRQEIPKPDAIKLLVREDICKYRKVKRPEKFIELFWTDVEKERMTNPRAIKGKKSSGIDLSRFQTMTRAEKAKELASFMPYPSIEEIYNFIRDQHLLGKTTESKIRREAAYIYGQMWRDGWCTTSKPLRILSRSEMRRVFEGFTRAVNTSTLSDAQKAEFIILFQFSLITGMRPSEIFSTQIADLHLGGNEVCIYIPKGKTHNAKRCVHVREIEGFKDYYDQVTQYIHSCLKNNQRPFHFLFKHHKDRCTKNVTLRLNQILIQALSELPSLRTPDDVPISVYTLRHCSAYYRIQDCLNKHYWNGNFFSALAGEADQFGHGHFGVTLGSYVGVAMSLFDIPQPKFGS